MSIPRTNQRTMAVLLLVFLLANKIKPLENGLKLYHHYKQLVLLQQPQNTAKCRKEHCKMFCNVVVVVFFFLFFFFFCFFVAIFLPLQQLRSNFPIAAFFGSAVIKTFFCSVLFATLQQITNLQWFFTNTAINCVL